MTRRGLFGAIAGLAAMAVVPKKTIGHVNYSYSRFRLPPRWDCRVEKGVIIHLERSENVRWIPIESISIASQA